MNEAPSWIVRFDLLPEATLDDVGDDEVILAGPVIDGGLHGRRTLAASIRIQQPLRPLTSHSDRIEVRCTPRPLPPTGNAEPITSTDHVIHIICAKLGDPEAIEAFLASTRGIIDGFWTGREVWLEPTKLPTDVPSGEGTAPLFDDVFVARYPDLESWQRLNADPDWRLESARMEASMAAIMHVVIAPETNTLAYRR